MDVSPPNLMLKIIWLVHFLLASWALMSGYLSVHTYWFTNAGMLGCGMWAMVAPESVDAVIMFLATMFISVINDIILVSIYEPRAYDLFEENDHITAGLRNEYRFALGMTIMNLLIKPVSMFLLYRVYQSRADGSEFNTGFPKIGGSSDDSHGGGYSNIAESNHAVHDNDKYNVARSGDTPGNSSRYYQDPPSAYDSPPPPEKNPDRGQH